MKLTLNILLLIMSFYAVFIALLVLSISYEGKVHEEKSTKKEQTVICVVEVTKEDATKFYKKALTAEEVARIWNKSQPRESIDLELLRQMQDSFTYLEVDTIKWEEPINNVKLNGRDKFYSIPDED